MTLRSRAVVATVVSLSAVAVLGAYFGGRALEGKHPLPRPGCTVQGSDRTTAAGAPRRVTLEPDQMANAATIAATGVRRKVPERAIVVALATAYQESELVNVAGGDRDSIGLFQQRPSQGWGTPEELRDPRYAANRFYAALGKVKGWERLRVTDAAQAVQRSAYPEAYQKWADEAQVLADALMGISPGAVACLGDTEPPVRGTVAEAALLANLTLDWGNLEARPPAGRPGLALPAADDQAGWRYAHWLVSHAGQHGVQRVRYAGRQWTAQAGNWSPAPDRTPGGKLVVAEVFAAD
ncbi:MAG TPA: hypothetical protein VF462_13825 [Micromonosporaceae bacterium]